MSRDGAGRRAKTSQRGLLERVERGQAAAGIESDGPAGPAAERAGETDPALEQRTRPCRLEREQRRDPLAPRPGQVVVDDREAAQILVGQVHPSEREVAWWVLEEVHELKPGAHVVRACDELRVVRASVDAEHETPHRLGRVRAVLAQLVPGLVMRLSLVDPIRLDEPRERLPRKAAGHDGRVQAAHDLGLRRAVELPLELGQQRRSVALRIVPEHVDEPCEAVDRTQVRPCPARRQQRRHGEVLAGRLRVDLRERELGRVEEPCGHGVIVP